MEALDKLIANLQSIEEQIGEAIESAVRENEAFIIDMNIEDQLFENGINSLGESISSYMPYSPVTRAIKKEKGQPTNRVTLRDTKDFHNSFFIEFQTGGFQIKARDWKTGSLIKKYGPEILGLTDDNFNNLLQNYILPEIINLFESL